MLIRIESNPLGRRLHILHWRCHHYHVGMALVVLGTELADHGHPYQGYTLALIGLRLVWGDRVDFGEWVGVRSQP